MVDALSHSSEQEFTADYLDYMQIRCGEKNKHMTLKQVQAIAYAFKRGRVTNYEWEISAAEPIGKIEVEVDLRGM